MRENGIKSVRFRLRVFWPGALFFLAAALRVCWKEASFFFFHIYKWGLFMYSPGTACFLKGFMRIWLYIQWGAPHLCRIITYSIILRMIWNGWAPWNWTIVVCIRAVCQSAGDERSQRMASRLLKPMSNGEKRLAERRGMKESRGVMGETGGHIFMYQGWKDQPKSEGEDGNVLNECSALACLWSLPAPSPSYWRFILIMADATVGEEKTLVKKTFFFLLKQCNS